MRYQSLRFVSILIKALAVFYAIADVALFIYFEDQLPRIFDNLIIGTTRIIVQDRGITERLIPFVFMMLGFVISICIYAGGAFIMLLIDMEQSVRNIDERQQAAEMEHHSPSVEPTSPYERYRH